MKKHEIMMAVLDEQIKESNEILQYRMNKYGLCSQEYSNSINACVALETLKKLTIRALERGEA